MAYHQCVIKRHLNKHDAKKHLNRHDIYIMETLRKHFFFEERAFYVWISHLCPKEALNLLGKQGAKYTLSLTGLGGIIEW